MIFVCKGFDQKSKNWKYPCLSFFQYQETEASQGFQIWLECLFKKLVNVAKMPIFQFLPFLG